ncbi:MAG TPA: DUF4915 domain-containing protein [Acidimicrobiales bacterium]|nr:DUF4915 domain-containing protein [Acidimicrobiales bacterium]
MKASWQHALGDRRLLVSGFGRWGGGIYDLTDGEPEALDNIPTSGLALGGGRLWRALRAPGEQTAACELLSYDDQGVRSYERLDTIRDPHDICWHDDALLVTSSWDGIVWRTEPGRPPTVVWRGGTVPDSWHVNSLVTVDGRLHVCAFGRFDRHKAWRAGDGDGDRDGAATEGFVHDVERGVDVLSDLAHPHHPRRVGDRWLLCESTRGTLTECDATGRVVRRVGVDRFSRGLAVVGPWAIVGGNAHREDDDDRAEVVVVDLDSFTVVGRVRMPCLEVYDILPVPPELARAVAVGFGANPARAVEQHRGDGREPGRHSAPETARVHLVTAATAATLATAGELLDREAAGRCKVQATLPTGPLRSGGAGTLTVTVVNDSPLALASVPPHPVRVGARWIRSDDRNLFRRGPLSALPRLLHADDRVEVEVLLVAPDEPGRYELRLALHQTGRGWFGRRTSGEVVVEAAAEPVNPVEPESAPVEGQPLGSVMRP